MKKLFLMSACFTMVISLFCFPVFAEDGKTESELDQMFNQAIERYEEKSAQNEDAGIKYGEVQNQNGSKRYKVKVFPVSDPQTNIFSTNRVESQTYVFKLDEKYMEREWISTFGQDYGENWVAQSGVKGYLTVYYNGAKNYGTLTQVTGGWDIHDGSMQVTNKHIIARTGNSRADFYPNGLYFNYSTGFTEVSASEVTSIADIVRGGDVWSCVFYV